MICAGWEVGVALNTSCPERIHSVCRVRVRIRGCGGACAWRETGDVVTAVELGACPLRGPCAAGALVWGGLTAINVINW